MMAVGGCSLRKHDDITIEGCDAPLRSFRPSETADSAGQLCAGRGACESHSRSGDASPGSAFHGGGAAQPLPTTALPSGVRLPVSRHWGLDEWNLR